MTTFTNDQADQLIHSFRAAARTAAGEDLAALTPALLRLLAEGRPVSPQALAAATGRPIEQVTALLAQAGVERNDEGDVVGLGLTLVPTPHRFEVDGRALFTWCAPDTLIFPPLLGRPARIDSPCRATGRPVHVEVTPERVQRVEPVDAVVSISDAGAPETLQDHRRSFCDNGHFFSSSEAAATWLEQHPGSRLVSVADAFRLGRLVARALAGLADQP